MQIGRALPTEENFKSNPDCLMSIKMLLCTTSVHEGRSKRLMKFSNAVRRQRSVARLSNKGDLPTPIDNPLFNSLRSGLTAY